MGTTVTGQPTPTAATDAFIHAIQWGEHTTVWGLLSESGRSTALSVAVTNGLDRVTASRIRDDVSDPRETADFLSLLLGGLRRDLRSVDIDRLESGGTQPNEPDGTVTVELTNPSTLPGTEHWSAGQLVLSEDPAGDWRIDRLVPRVAGP